MHDGRAATLKEAVELMTEYQLGRYMKEGEIEAIVVFLESLTGEYACDCEVEIVLLRAKKFRKDD